MGLRRTALLPDRPWGPASLSPRGLGALGARTFVPTARRLVSSGQTAQGEAPAWGGRRGHVGLSGSVLLGQTVVLF